MSGKIRAGRGIFLIVVIVLFVGIGSAILLDLRESEKVEIESERTGKAVYDNFSFLIGSDFETRIYGAYNPRDEIVYVTLPTYAQKTVRINFNATIDDVCLNEGARENGALFEVKVNEIYSMSLLFHGEPMTFSLCFKEKSAIPTLYIDMEAEDLDKIYASKQNKEDAHLEIVDARGDTLYYQPLEYIKTRGTYTWSLDKKSLKLKLKTKQRLLKSAYSCDEWVLVSCFDDRSFLRHMITFDAASLLQMPGVPSAEYTDVYINGEYYGLYLLCSAIDLDSVGIRDLEKETKRVNNGLDGAQQVVTFDEAGTVRDAYFDLGIDPVDITGGYLLRVEGISAVDGVAASGGFTTQSGGYTIEIVEPGVVSKAQHDYISSLLNSFERAIKSEDGTDPQSGKHYTEIIDAPTWAKKFLIEEFSKNLDAEFRSNYLYKDSDRIDALIYNAPVWDYGAAYGAYYGAGGFWYCCQYYAQKKSWSQDLFAREEFREQVMDLYEHQYAGYMRDLLSTGIDEITEEIEGSVSCDLCRWRTRDDVYSDAVDGLKEYISQRLEFLDSVWLEGVPYCTISYRSDIGTIFFIQRTIDLSETPEMELFELTADGYAFDGWYYEDHATRCDGDASSIDGEYLLLYAGWRNEEGELVFNDE